MKKSCPFHYGWVIFGLSILSAFIFVGLCSNTVSLYVQPVSDILGFSRGMFTLKNCLASLIGGVFALFYGKLCARFSLRSILSFGCICLLLCYLLQAKAVTLTMFYISAVFQGFGVGACSMAGVAILMNRWFSAHYGVLFGAIYTATSIGGALFFPLLGGIIERSGYRWGFLLSALCVLVYFVLLLFLFSERPEDLGLKPVFSADPAAESAGPEQAAVPDAAAEGPAFAEILRAPRFWAAVILVFLVSLTGISIQGTMTARLVDVGFPLSFATAVVSILYVFTSLVKIPSGAWADHSGVLPVLLFSLANAIAALVLLIVVKTRLTAYLMTPFMGASMVLFTVPVPLIGPTLFGRRAVAQMTGVFMGAQSLGTAVGSTLFNFLYDRSGSYVSSYLFCIAVMLFCMAAFCVLFRRGTRNWLLEAAAARQDKTASVHPKYKGGTQ